SGPGTVTITIIAENDAPDASSQSVTVNEDTSLPITLAGTDAEGDPLTFEILTQPEHGELTGTAPDVVYTPGANYFGPDGFTFRVADGQAFSVAATISITVNGVNDAPSAEPLFLNVTTGRSTQLE